jgi:hypothetical protein
MKRIYLGFSTSKKCKPFSALIKWWWRTPYSHVYLRWPTPWGFDEVLEASGSQVRMVEHGIWEKKNVAIKEISFDIPREQWNEVMKQLRAKTGTPYGHLQLLSIAVCELLGMDKNPWGDDDASWICSELATKFLGIVGKLPPGTDIDRVTPYDVWEIVHK